MSGDRAAGLERAVREGVLIADGATGSLLDLILGDALSDRRDLVPLERPEVAASVHRSYLEAGARIIKTATFNANARGLARLVPAGDQAAASDLARRVNAASARLARAAAGEMEAKDGVERWVAGSVGPGSEAPSLGVSSYAELRASYLPQMEGLVEGGADLALIETAQDPLQVKAAIGALREACAALGREIPFIASATVDARGTMLSGADPGAFAAIIEPFRPLAIGLNCSGGPAELESAFEALAAASSRPISIMPNAGLPRSVGGGIEWPLGPAEFGAAVAAIARRLGASIAGGCCGSGPAHIAALAEAMKGAVAPAPRPARSFALASGFKASKARASGPFVIDERSNASGGAAFKALLKSGDLDAAAMFVVDRAAKGPGACDISVAGSVKDEAGAMKAIVSKAASIAAAALSVDTTSADVAAAALPLIGGRPLLNSVNLEDRANAARLFDLAAEHGAAVVCLAMDGRGPARDRATKLEICRSLYGLALERGLAPEDLLFDTCTFPVASGDSSLAASALETIAAVGALAEACPGSMSVLGVGNSSFGLPKALRPAFTARFAAKAIEAGLGAAIVDPAILALEVPAGLADAADAVIEARGGPEGYSAAIERILSFAPGAAEAAAAQAELEKAAGDASEPLDALPSAVIAGDQKRAAAAARAAAQSHAATAVAAKIADAMAELGRRYDAGLIPLPLVLRSADAARDAFAALRGASERQAEPGPSVVLSTVKGDLHDIGKNLVGMVLEAAGFGVTDLGTDRDASDIAARAAEAGAVAVGVSGLLTKSLAEMERVAKALANSGSAALLLCGGAAVEPDYVAERIEPLRPGLVAYAKDPFEAVALLKGGAAARADQAGCACSACAPKTPAHSSPAAAAPGQTTSSPSVLGPAFDPPFLGSRRLGPIGFDALLEALDRRAIYRARWGYKDDAEGSAALDSAIGELRASGGAAAECRYGFYMVDKPDSETVRFDDGMGASAVFAFPREKVGQRRSVADYYSGRDSGAAFCVTLGPRATEYLARIRKAGDSEAYVRAHGLLAGLAESAAEIAHERVFAELAARGAASRGKRYSFGFPGCPGVEANAGLLSLLGGGSIGLRVTSGFQLDPEFSVTAVLVPRAEAKYLNA